MRDVAGEVKMDALATFSSGPHQTDEKGLVDQLKCTYNSSVWTQDVV